MTHSIATLHTDCISFFPYLDDWSEEAHEEGEKDRACFLIRMLEGFEGSSFYLADYCDTMNY